MGAPLVSCLQKSFALSLAVMLTASPLAAASLNGQAGNGQPSGSANTLDEGLRLNTAVTVEGGAVTLGDLFEGYLSRPEKVVAQAPRPGQRLTLSAEWLENTARTYGLDWHPANAYDRAVIYQPGHTITAASIIEQVKAVLIANGMPENYGLSAATQIAPVTVALSASKEIDVREAVYNAATKTFSAVVQVPPNDPQATFIQIRGTAFATVQVPVLKDAAGKSTLITAAMIDMVDVAEDQLHPATLTDPNLLIGKTPKLFLKAGQPVRATDVAQINLVEVPVLITAMDREDHITKAQVKMVEMNAANVPADAVTDAAFLIGKTPRRTLQAGQPIRRADVLVVRQVEVPVTARDLPRGATMTADDVTWVLMDEALVSGEMFADNAEIVGQTTRFLIRAGQPLRKHTLAKITAVNRGQMVTVLWSAKSMNLTAQGKAMEKGGVGDVIKVTNTKSNQTMLAEIIDERTVRIAAPAQTSAR